MVEHDTSKRPAQSMGQFLLLDRITEGLLLFLANRFSVDPEWLRGRSKYIWLASVGGDRHWYRGELSEGRFCRYLAELRRSGTPARVSFVRSAGDVEMQAAFDRHQGAPEVDVGIMVEAGHRTRYGTTYKTYRWWGAASWNYHKTRQSLKTIIKFCEHHLRDYEKFEFYGKDVSETDMRDLASGTILPVEVFKRVPYRGFWRPEQYVDSSPPWWAKETAEYDVIVDRYKRVDDAILAS